MHKENASAGVINEGASYLLNEDCLVRKNGFSGGSTLSKTEFSIIRWSFWAMMAAFILAVVLYLFFAFFPFNTVNFIQPIQVDNSKELRIIDGKEVMMPVVPVGGVVELTIYYEKFTEASGLIIRTLVRKKGKEILVLDSSTVVSNRPAGSGITHALIPVVEHPLAIGPDCYVIFSIYYHIFGFRTEMIQFETVPFEIVKRGSAPCPDLKQ